MKDIWILLFLLGVTVLQGCQKTPDISDELAEAEIVVLEEYEVISPAEEDVIIGSPQNIRFDPGTDHLFIYDQSQKTVWEIDRNGSVHHRYGGEGRGPGELANAHSMFLSDEHLFVHDFFRYYIHQYERGGNHIASFDLGAPAPQGTSGAPPAPRRLNVVDSYKEPHIMLNGNLLSPSDNSDSTLFELTDLEGNRIGGMGEIPQADEPAMDDETYRSTLENRMVPLSDMRRAFPVNDPANPDELFMIYGNIPRIVKYASDGTKLWEKDIPPTAELDTLIDDHLQRAEDISFQQRLPLRKYVSGVASPGGELYLAPYTNLYTPGTPPRPLWIHRFNAEGELIRRYRVQSDEDVRLLYYFGLDPDGTLFALNFLEGEIRAYPFDPATP